MQATPFTVASLNRTIVNMSFCRVALLEWNLFPVPMLFNNQQTGKSIELLELT